MASTNDLYFTISGLAHIKGLNSFPEAMPVDRFSKLHRAYLETKGFKWVENHFINTVLAIAGRYHRDNGLFVPQCTSGPCKYRMKFDVDKRQVNALRIETICFSDRCGWNLKDGRIGGRSDDYHACPYAKP